MIFLDISYFIKKKMNSKIQKYEFLFPERVYRCPSLCLAIEECFFNEENSSIADIAYYLADFEFKNKLLMSRIFSTRVGENKEHCLFTCEAHLRTIILGMRKFVCTSVENEQTVSVEYSNKKEVYCIDSARHYMLLAYNFFEFVQFDFFSFTFSFISYFY